LLVFSFLWISLFTAALMGLLSLLLQRLMHHGQFSGETEILEICDDFLSLGVFPISMVTEREGHLHHEVINPEVMTDDVIIDDAINEDVINYYRIT
jgi:hypothetical protein